MTRSEVSLIVESILTAFKNGMDVFKRTDRRKHKKHSRHEEEADEGRKLQKSLSNRPREIRAQYQQNVSRHGQRFEVGDSTSQHSLAHILLVLNTGLIKILNLALSGDTKEKSMSRKSLLNLSESAAMDTLSALSELNSRLSLASSINLAQPRHFTPLENRDTSNRRRDIPHPTSPTRKRPPPNPLLKRGGWVRSSSGSSVVSVVPSPRVRQGEHKRSQSVPSLVSNSRRSKDDDVQTRSHKSTSPPLKTVLPATVECEAPIRPSHPRRRDTEPIRRPPSMIIVPKDFFDSHYVTPYEPQQAPPRPPKIPLHSKPHIGIRPRPPSMMTCRTASTKIGEIPEDRLPDRVLSLEEQQRTPMPYLIPLPLEQPKKKRGLKFWKRTEQYQSVAA